VVSIFHNVTNGDNRWDDTQKLPTTIVAKPVDNYVD